MDSEHLHRVAKVSVGTAHQAGCLAVEFVGEGDYIAAADWLRRAVLHLALIQAELEAAMDEEEEEE